MVANVYAVKFMETQVAKVEGFNPTAKPRRNWQNGVGNISRYTMNSDMFKPKQSWNTSIDTKYTVHNKIRDACEAVQLIPNPYRPKLYELVSETPVKLRDLRKSGTQPYFEKFDIVWFTFSVTFVVQANDWATELSPIECIKVGSVPLDSTRVDYGVSWDESQRPSLPTIEDDTEDGAHFLSATYSCFRSNARYVVVEYEDITLSEPGSPSETSLLSEIDVNVMQSSSGSSVTAQKRQADPSIDEEESGESAIQNKKKGKYKRRA